MKTYLEVDDWLRDQAKLVDQEWDNIHLVTGDEGVGKSRWMRKCARRIDPTFTVERIHFTQDDFLDQATTLPPGASIILDEFRGHRRLAMHGDRMEFLDFAKECRALLLNMWIGFPHVAQFERDLLHSRIRWWEHLPRRGQVVVRKRVGETVFDMSGEPKASTKFPIVAKFPLPDSPDKLEREYLAKKHERMRDRAARFKENHNGAPPEPPKSTRLPPAFLDMALADLKRAA